MGLEYSPAGMDTDRSSYSKDQTTIDDFEIIKPISRGAFGRVFLARKRTTCDIFAIKLDCGGSIYGSLAISEVNGRLYVPSTNGFMTPLSLKTNPFSMLWMQDMGAPIFDSVSVNQNNGNVICCLVNGYIVVVDATESIV